MTKSMKDRYNYESLHEVANDIKENYQSFQVESFLKSIFEEPWDCLELKERITKISTKLGEFLPKDFKEAISVIDKVVMNYGNWQTGFGAFFPIFIEIYGQNDEDWDISMDALERYTQYASAEFAVRSFILKDEKRMMDKMLAWSKSDDEYARRLSSEGCRPVLPWGQALLSFQADPTPVLPILEQLKNDPSMHVRKSVANNLNDISKTHPDLVIETVSKWYGKSEETDWIIKNGCRTLLKNGSPKVLTMFGYGNTDDISVKDFKMDKADISIGENISFSFLIHTEKDIKLRIEYGIDYMKSNGKRSRKIFKLTEISLHKNESKIYTRNHSFADTGTRKHYTGIHSLTLIINGIDCGTLDFNVSL